MAMNSGPSNSDNDGDVRVAVKQEEPYEILNSELRMYVGHSSINLYRKLEPVSWEGCDLVFKAENKSNGDRCTIKIVESSEPNGKSFPQDVYSEIRILQRLKHENVLALTDVVIGSKLDSIFLVFSHYNNNFDADDFYEILKHRKHQFVQSEVKCVMAQFLHGLDYVHQQNVIHRELTSAKLLIDPKGIVKISGFHAAVESGNDVLLSPDVGSMFYRAPELVFGSDRYTAKIDLWSAGCIFGELLLGKHIFPAESDKELIDMIVELLGTPSDAVMPGFRSLPLVNNFELKDQPSNMIKSTFKISNRGRTLMNQLLTYDPERRFSAAEALSSDYFTEEPLSCGPLSLCLAVFTKTTLGIK